VPHIQANNDRDVFFGMGYVHAQDRLWQLEVQKRIAGGRLAEVFGREALKQDIWLRTLGLYEAAKTDWPALSSEAQQSLSAYTDGINAWLKTHDTLPPEFTLMGVKAEAWTVFDSLAWIKVFSLSLSGNFEREIGRYLAAQTLNSQEMATFFSGHDRAGPITVQASDRATLSNLAAVADLQHGLASSLQIGGKFVGSNAWAVSGKFTKDGSAILANDPHLGLQIPSLFYAVSQEGLRLKGAGMSLVGLPLVIFGQNGEIGWGGTNMMADTQDIYFEQVSATDPDVYRVNETWKRFDVREESIAVKADFPTELRSPIKPVVIKVRSSRHGPIISDVVGVLRQPIALRWTALVSGDTTYEAFLRLNYAHDWESFRAALKYYVSPALNMVFTGKDGNIGYLGVGRIPLRNKGNGALPSPGWTDEYEWKGVIPFNSMPQSYNPESGYIVSANNKVVGSDYPYFISNDWASPARAQRIVDLLEKYKKDDGQFTVDQFKHIQADVMSLPAARMVPLMTALLPNNPRQREALGYLKAWNGEMRADSQAATIFNVWTKHLGRQLFFDRLQIDWPRRDQTSYLESMVEEVSIDDLYAILADKNNPWCAHIPRGTERDCSKILSVSLDAAISEIERVAGHKMGSWEWGRVHFARYEHTPFSKVKLLDTLFERRAATGGSADTINVANATLNQSNGYEQKVGASFRQIIQMGPKQVTHLYMNSTGQSGNVVSSNYDNMVKPFQNVSYLALQLAKPEKGTSTILLTPTEQAWTGAKR